MLKILVGVGLGFLLFTNEKERLITADLSSKQRHMRFLRSMTKNAAIRRITEKHKIYCITYAQVRGQSITSRYSRLEELKSTFQ